MDLFQKRRSLKRMSEKLQLRFLKRLAYLMDHGYPLIQALDIIAWDRELEFYAEKMSVNLKKGLSIDQAFLNLHFHSTIIAYMYFAQSHGNLSYSLKQCIKMVESRLTAVQRFKQVLRYPLLLFFTFFLLLLFIKFSVLPSFLDLYVSHAGASKTILLSIKVVNIALTLGIVKVIIILLSIYLWFFMRGRLPIKTEIRLYRSLPFVRSIISMYISYQFSLHLNSLIKASMPMNEILDTIEKQKKLPILSYFATSIKKDLLRGDSLTQIMHRLPLIEPHLSDLFQKNKDMSSLEKDLSVYSELTLESFKQRMMQMIAWVQPTFFILVGTFIILIYMALMWPMFQLIQTL